jgi:hypothetical protein
MPEGGRGLFQPTSVVDFDGSKLGTPWAAEIEVRDFALVEIADGFRQRRRLALAA